MIQNLEKKVPVLVTGIGGGGHGEQIIKALRLGKLKYHIYGTDISGLSANRNQVDDFFIVPRADSPYYLDSILDIAEKFKAVALFHGSEQEMMVFSRHKNEIMEKGIYLPVNPPSVMEICQDKNRTMSFLGNAGFRTPYYKEANSYEDLKKNDTFPVVLKPSRGGGGSANTFIVQNTEELQSIGQYLLKIHSPIILQEYVGTPDKEFTVGILFGSDGSYINSIAVRRIINNALSIRSWVPNKTPKKELGERLVISSGISQGEVGKWPEVTEQCKEMGKALGAEAPINIQCRFIDGKVVPFEINPRFSGTTSLRAMVGYNEPDTLIRRDIMGEKILPDFYFKQAVILRGLIEFIVEKEMTYC